MAYCTNCGRELFSDAKFCSECGAPTESNFSARKTTYEGEVRKCPLCGEIINAFVPVCPTCGHELRGTKASNSVKELADKLERIERTREHNAHNGQLTKTDEQKISLIRSFSIPNTKEDIVEFMILASSNIDLKLYGLGYIGKANNSQRAVSDAWLAKFEQTYEKARFTFGSSSEFSNIQSIYEQKQKQLKWKKATVRLLIGAVALLFILLILDEIFYTY